MTTFESESELLGPVSKFIRHRSYHRQAQEVSFYEYRIDLYAFSRKLGNAVAVELKLKRWTRAVEQALVYQLCAEHVYVALPNSEAALVPTGLLLEHGIGLIAVGETRCRELVSPQRSIAYRPDYAEVYERVLCERQAVV